MTTIEQAAKAALDAVADALTAALRGKPKALGHALERLGSAAGRFREQALVGLDDGGRS